MNIRPSAAIRQNYNEIADLCRKTAEPVLLTKNGEGDLVVMDLSLIHIQMCIRDSLYVSKGVEVTAKDTVKVPEKEDTAVAQVVYVIYKQNERNSVMEKTMEKIVALAKSRGFVYPGSEIYGGLANTWDYGNLGVELKNNVKKAWWQKFIQESPYNVGVDLSLIHIQMCIRDRYMKVLQIL